MFFNVFSNPKAKVHIYNKGKCGLRLKIPKSFKVLLFFIKIYAFISILSNE